MVKIHARIFVLGYYLFLVAHSFPQASLSENCSLLGTDNVQGQIFEYIFAPNGDYCLYNYTPQMRQYIEAIGNFRLTLNLFFKASLGAHLSFGHMQIKHI